MSRRLDRYSERGMYSYGKIVSSVSLLVHRVFEAFLLVTYVKKKQVVVLMHLFKQFVSYVQFSVKSRTIRAIYIQINVYFMR